MIHTKSKLSTETKSSETITQDCDLKSPTQDLVSRKVNFYTAQNFTHPTYLYPVYANKSRYLRSVVTLRIYITKSRTIISITVHTRAVLAVKPKCSGVKLKTQISYKIRQDIWQ